ncbi:MAG TPA: AraC family transcriptional regulator [Cytophagaceae bacterium]|jgi:AraC-like DNA-binding protein
MPIEYPKVYLYKRIVHAKLFIDNNFSNHIDLDNIAGEAYFSKFHFIRLFKKCYGKTPHQYLIYVRMQRAIKLLQEGNAVCEVCQTVGFESVSSFSGLFKRNFGCSPSEYLLQHREMEAQVIETPLNYVPSCFVFQHGWAE